MANYQIWALNDAYTKVVLLANTGSQRTWTQLRYAMELNAMRGATVDLVANASVISSLDTMQRLLIIRDGTIVFGGLILGLDWGIEQTAPEGDTFRLQAVDYGCYAQWRAAIPAAASEYDARTENADDLAKDYVYYHAGAGAGAGRPFTDLTVEADEGAVGSITWQARYDNLLSLLQEIADYGAFDWRFVPSATGVEFQTAYPYWGLDRTKGNGVNAEMIISMDRRNWRRVGYREDLFAHRNFCYVAGQGEGADRTIVERSTAGDITAYKRREVFIDARALETTASLNQRGDAKLKEMKAVIELSGEPLSSTWPGSWGLGDQITIYINRYGRTFSQNAQNRAIEVTVGPDTVEDVRGTFVAI